MKITKFLVLSEGGLFYVMNDYPRIVNQPYDTLETACDALKAEFEKVVKLSYGIHHVIKYAPDGTAELLDDHKEYSLKLNGNDGPCFFVWDGDKTTYRGVVREISIEIDDPGVAVLDNAIANVRCVLNLHQNEYDNMLNAFKSRVSKATGMDIDGIGQDLHAVKNAKNRVMTETVLLDNLQSIRSRMT